MSCAHVRGSKWRLVPFWPGCCRDWCSASVPRTTGAPMTLLPSSNTPQSRSKRPLWRPIDHIAYLTMFPLRNRLKSYLKDTVSSSVSSKSYRRRQHHPGYTPYSEHTRYQAITATQCTINHRHARNLSSIEAHKNTESGSLVRLVYC